MILQNLIFHLTIFSTCLLVPLVKTSESQDDVPTPTDDCPPIDDRYPFSWHVRRKSIEDVDTNVEDLQYPEKGGNRDQEDGTSYVKPVLLGLWILVMVGTVVLIINFHLMRFCPPCSYYINYAGRTVRDNPERSCRDV